MQLSPAPAFGFLHRGDEIFSRKVVAIAQIAGVEREKSRLLFLRRQSFLANKTI